MNKSLLESMVYNTLRLLNQNGLKKVEKELIVNKNKIRSLDSKKAKFDKLKEEIDSLEYEIANDLLKRNTEKKLAEVMKDMF